MSKLFSFIVVMIVSCCSVNAQNTTITGPKKVGQSNNSISKQSKRGNTANGQYSSPKAVDLGLSVKWADRNVGARSIYDYGNEYAWGETSTKKEYSSRNYRYYSRNVDPNTGSHYVNLGRSICGTKYDAARVNWGKPWRMPTKAEMNELATKCKWGIIKVKGKDVCKVTGPNGNYIYILTDGVKLVDEENGGDWTMWGSYWTGDNSEDEIWRSWSIYLWYSHERNEWYIPSANYTNNLHGDARWYGQAVRPVCD